MTSTDVGPLDLNVQLTQEQGSKDVTDDVLQIISAIEQGQDPSAVDEEFAPAAGENGGSSLQTSATIVRDGTELLASTSFETIGIESLGLSQTQVLALNDLFRSNLQTSADSTDKPLATTPVTLDAIEEDGGSIIITTEELLSNVDDEDKDTLSVENLIIDKGNGTLVDNGDGTWTFTPQIDDDTEVSFTFDIIDDEDLVVSGSANLDILPINDAPNAENDVITTEEDTAVTIDVLVNDSDVEGDALSIQSASVPSEQGSVDIVDGKLVFTPAENFNGEATITYIVTDGDLTDEAKVTVTVTPVNDSPVAVDDTTSIQEDTAVTIDVLTNDTDVDGDKLSIESASVPKEQGTVEVVDGKLVFTPAENFNGDAEITYTVTDGELTDEAKVTVTVNPVNDAPTIKVDAVESITEDAVSTDTVVATLTVRDTDTPEDQLTVSLENNSNGYFVLVGDEVKLTQAGVDAVNNDELNLKGLTISASVSDGVNPTASDSDSLIVNRVNDAPTIKVDAVESITEDAVSTDTVVATLTVRDTDTPEDQLTVSLENNSNGYFVLVGNEVKLTQAGVDAVNNDELNLKDLTISASVSDGVNPTANDSDSLIVNRVNDAPVAKDDIATTQEDTSVTIDVLPNDSDVDGDKLSIQSASVPEAQGKVEIVDGKLVFTPAENFHGDAEITYTLTDGALTDQATVNVTVNAVNDTPVVESNIADQALAEDFTPYTIVLNTAFSDVDNVDGELTFSVSGNSNVLVSIENGIATISPTADWNGSETLTFTATDPNGESISQTVNFTVAPVADIVADKATVVEDTPTIIKVLGNDTFEDDGKVVSLDTNNGPANGTVSVNPDGSVTYTPNDNYVGKDTFTYVVTSGGVSESTTVEVNVTPVNDAPVAKDDIATTQEDTAVTIDVLPNDTDVDGDTLSIQSASVPSDQGTVEIVDGKLVFTPAENFNGDAEITYTVTDGQLTDEAKVTVTVNPVNDAPTIKVDAVESITEDAVNTDTVVATLTVRDTDTPEDQLTVSLENNSNGYFVLVGDEVKLTQAGVDAVNNDELNLKGLTISASVSDGVNPTASDSDSLIVNRVNDAPTIKVDAVESITEDAVSTDTVVATLTVRDTDTPEDQLTVSLENNSNGYFVLVGNEVKLTQAGVDAVNNDELNLKDLTISASVSDGVNPTANDSDSLIVNRVNDAPTVENAIADQVLSEDFASYTIDLNDAFKDSDSALNFSVSGNSNVLVSIENGIATISPTADWNGSETLTFTATDPSGESVSQTVNFTVAPVADIVADNATVVEDTPTIINVLGNDTFEGKDKVVSLDAENGPKNGTIIVNNDGTVTYTPDDNYVGKDTFTYVVTSGGVSESATVEVNVTPVNDAPVAKDDIATTQEDTAVTIDVLPNDTDVDGDKLSIESASVPKEQGTVEVVDGKLVFTPTENFNGDAEITYTVTDGAMTDQATVKVTVNAVNDTPVVESNIADQTLAEDFTPYTIDLNTAFSDVDNVDGELTFSVSGNSNIQVAIVNGIATITPTADWNGSETLTFTATDPSGESVSQPVNFTVAPVADIVADKATVVEDTSTVIKVLGNDTFEGDGKVVSLDTNNGPANGTVSVNPDGSVTYTPNENYHGADSFTYIVTSGGVSESTTVNVDVTPVNDAPVAKADTAVTDEDTPVTIDVLPNDTDVDGDTLSIQSASVPEAQGKVEIVEGKLVFTPAENFNGDAEITYTVTDGQLTDEAKVAVTVNPVNDAPTIKVDAVESITEDAVNTDTVVASLTVRDTDTPEDQLTVSLENNSNGYFVLVGNEVKLTQVGVDAVNNDELNLKDLTISASVSDGVNPTASDSDSLVVNRVNDAPTVENAIADQVLSEDFDTYTIDLNEVFKDSDSSLEFSVSGNSNIQVAIVNGIATITPTADWNGSETLTFTATDPSGESVSQTVDFTVAPVVDIKADSTNVVEDTPTIINVLGNDTFEGKDKVVSLDAENGPKNGTVTVNNDGTVTYIPDDNYVGKDTFTYVVTSGGVSESTTVTVNVTPVNDKPESEDFTHVADDQLTHVVFDTDTKPLGSGDSKDHIADVEDDLKGNDLHVRITELPTSGTLFFKDSDGELHEIKEVSDTLYDKDSLYYEADNVGFLLGIKDRPNTPNGSESTSDFNNWGLSEDGGPSHSRIEHLANGASITISSDSGELAQYNRQVSHIGNGIADNDGQGIEKGETITVDLSNNPVGSVNLGLDGLGGLFDYGDDNAALITVTYLDSNNVQQTQTFEFLKPEGNFMLFQETSVGYGKDLALPEGSVITQLDFSTKNEGNWELRYVEGVPAEDSFGYVAVDSESGVSDPSTVNIVNEMLDGNVAENGPAVQSITGVTVVEGDNVTFSVSLNNATDQTVKYQVDFSAEGSSTSSQDIDLSNATFTNGVKYLGGYLIVPAGVNGFDITIPSIDDQLVESTESLVIKVGDVSGVGYINDNDVPPTVQSNEISGLEDEAIVITLEHLGVVDSGVSVEFDTSALNGSLQVKGSDGWEAVSGSVLASDIENGLVRYVPAEHESGANVFDKDGVGNGLDTYEQIHFTVSDGNSSASGTLSIDIEPVADPIKIDLTFGPVTSVPVTLGGSWSTDEELKDLLEASNLPGLDFEHVVTQAFNNGHAGNDLMLSGDTESPLSFVGDQQAGANVDAQGSDIFVTGGGNDSIYGGIGSLDDQAETDTVVYSGKLSDYDFSYYPASDHSEVPYWIVEDSRFIDTKDVVSSTHKESGDHLYEIEQLIFQDAIIKLDNNTGEYVVLTEQQVSFELNLDLIDVDGSESFINDSVTLTGIPSGLTLEVNGKTVTENSDGSYTVDLSSEPNQTSHQLSGTITVPADYNGSLDFDVTATAGSVEVNNNTQMGADTASVSVRDYEFVSGTHGDNNIVGSDDNDVIVGDVQGLQIVEGQDYNIAFMLDTSGSMGYDVGRAVTELKTVLNTLIESASGPHSGKVNVLLTTFSTESKQVLELDLSSDNAKSQVESILDAIVKRGDGNTNYEAGFQSALNWFDSADSGATNLSYFISDGRPNQATVNDANNINQMDSIVLGVENNKLVTLADVLPADYKTGDVVTYDNKTVIDSNSLVYSLSTGELLGKMTSNHSYYDYETYVLHQANNAYQALEELSEVRSIGLGHDLDEDSLKHFDSDGVVRTNIDVNQLAEVILGKEVSLMQGKDEISSLDGNDIIFGDAIRFDINGEQGVSALQNYVASQLGKDVALVTKEEVHHYITENQAEFEQSRYYDQADTIYGGAGNDILFGQGGNDKLFGGADNDILIGGLGSDILTGGDGEDIFKWIDVANERDTVTDFSSSEDSLDFSDLFDDLSKDEVGDLLSDLQSGSHTGDAGGYHVEVSQDGSTDTNLSITKGSSTLDIHFNSASVDDITQHLIASLDSQYKDM
ncbi:tandem-95 repeat protein [Vibrio parahaemolyticus]